ncbi:MAG: hypothetical protein HEQ29_14105 [Dolichospermum sp. LBC05a]|nr:hypothetical protein [Dolichospermum sp. OL01]MCO5797850.1 hypothetical protein [Dolichospermum sp. OL03]QSV61211.1 MAG: hypothetical protein HEQ29_14105 [Dolichospermum sp. LBC05a]
MNTPITVTFAPGETYKDVQIPIAGDSVIENSETINLSLVNPSSGTLVGTQQPTAVLTIADLNQAPTDLALSATNVNENVAANSVIGTFSSTDVNAGNTFTYSLVSGTGATDNSSFTISGNQLQINASPDFETKFIYNIRVRTTDNGGLTFEKALTINVNNLNEILGTTGNNNLVGTANNDYIDGKAGNDTLNGGAGVDILIGGTGNDIYVVDSITDTITENANEGTDSIQSSVTFTLATLSNIENLTLTGTTAINGTGNDGNNVITGNTGNNILTGGLGNDTLNGGLGTDTLIGATGNDIYVVDSTTDTITENANEGTDSIQSSVTFTLATLSNIENLTLTGTTAINGTGNDGNNVITGNTGNNILTGGLGNDTLNGGLGTDTLIGATGNDIYVVDSTTDTITENANEGTDSIQSSVTFTLATLSNIENLTLTGTTAINGTGNDGNNVITGNTGNNILTGGLGNDTLNGGLGTDTLIGATGNDIYVVDSTTDTITENANEGTDSIQSSVTFTLATLSNIENLTLTGTTAINGTGNDGNNVITGNTGNNILTGGLGNDTLNGGLGTDTLIGATGNDIYVVDSTTDTITENANEGTDSIQSSVTFTLATLSNIENLTLTGITAINGTGNELNNVITGNTGNNILTGGLGNDTLTGNAGADTLIGGLGSDSLYLGLNDSAVDNVNYVLGDATDTVYQFVRGVGGDKLNFTGIANFDVITSGTSTLVRIGDGIGGNTGFATGQLLITLSGTTGFIAADVNVNLFGGNFLFS